MFKIDRAEIDRRAAEFVLLEKQRKEKHEIEMATRAVDFLRKERTKIEEHIVKCVADTTRDSFVFQWDLTGEHSYFVAEVFVSLQLILIDAGFYPIVYAPHEKDNYGSVVVYKVRADKERQDAVDRMAIPGRSMRIERERYIGRPTRLMEADFLPAQDPNLKQDCPVQDSSP